MFSSLGFSRFVRQLSRDHISALIIVVLLSFIVFASPSLYQYMSMQLLWHDAGHVYSMAMHYYESGIPFSYDLGSNHLNYHFFPFLYFIGALTELLGGGLLAFQFLHILAMIACSAFSYLFTRYITQNVAIALCVSFAFLANLYTNAINLSLHYEVFGMAFLFAFAYFAVKQLRILALLFMILAMAVKEDFWIYALLASLLMYKPLRLRDVSLYAATTLVYFVLVLQIFYSWLVPDQVTFVRSIWNYGDSIPQILKYLVLNANITVPRTLSGPGGNFLLSFGLVMFLAPVRSIFMLAALFIWTNSTSIERNSLSYYYTYSSVVLSFLIIPFAINNFIAYATRFKAKFGSFPVPAFVQAWMIPVFVLAFFCVRSQLFVPATFSKAVTLSAVFEQKTSERDNFIRAIMAAHLTHSDSSVLTQYTLAPYVPWREDLYIAFKDGANFLHGKLAPDYLIFDLSRPGFFLKPGFRRQLIDAALASGQYVAIVSRQDFYVLEKRVVKLSTTR